MGQKRRIYCKFCDFFCYSPDDYVSHIEKHHSEMIPPDMTPWQFTHYLRTGTAHGSCIVCKKDTSWNDVTHRYERLCDNPVCKEKYKELFKNRMIGKYGKTHLLNDPEQQKKMLANRKISGKYIWSDRVHFFSYTGSYEKEFLEFLDHMMNFDPNDIMAPSPHTYYYEYNGEKHFYIPDFFIPSLDLEIEIKDGGSNANTHPDIVAVNKVKEKLKDEVMMKNHFNYLKICDKQHMKFLQYLEKAKENFIDKTDKPIYMIEKEITLEDLNKLYTESPLLDNSDNVVTESSNVNNDNITTVTFPNNESIEYAKNDSELSRYLDTLIKDCVGEVLVDKETNKMIGYAFVYNKKHKDHGFIFNVFLKPPYRGRGLGKKLVNDVIHKYDGVDLTVKKDNKHAIDLYKKFNFVICGDGNSKSEYYMKLKSKLTKDDEIVEETCKDVRAARELASEVKKLAKKYDANFFFVTDGASTTNNNGNPAVQTAREAVAKWEREHGFDDVENWGKNPNDFSQYHLARYTKADVEKIIKRIHDKTVKDKKEPTGNQNCLLCTWCLEANLRGIDILPRAVYSPSDKIFSFDAISIFKNPKKEKFSNIEKFKSIVLNGGDNSRFYVHVNWKGSSGGHEFLVLNLSDKVYVADAQAGILHDIDSKGGKKYFTDINFSNSYTARVDQLILDKKYLEYNDKKYQLEWDDERDSKLVGESVYDPPMSLDDIKQNYGEELYKKLSSDPVHKWRAETGIELVHKEPTKQELIRIWNNWKAMPKDKQKISDKKSLELYGCTNEENYNKLLKSYKESVEDEYTTEASLVFNKSDLCKDIDKFESGKSNVLLVTGFSGSGKSTLAQELASKYNAKHIELDVLDMYNQDIDIKDLEKNEPALYAFINSHKKEDFTYSKYIPFVINWCKKQKDQKFIIEGLQLYDTFDEKNPQSYYNNPIIIKGTSALISTLRAYKRNNEYNKDHKGSLQLDGFKNLLKWVLKDIKSVKKLEQYVRN